MNESVIIIEKADMPTLYYFDLHGRGEPIRMLLTHAKVEFEDKRITNEEFAELRENGTLPSGQVPLWEDEGRFVNQTAAIMRLLGKQHGYYSMDPMEGYHADWAIDTLGDIFQPTFMGKYFLPAENVTEENITEVADKFGTWVKVLENKLKTMEGDFFGGKTMNVGDIMIFAFFCSAISNENVNCPALRDACAKKLEDTPNVAKWHDAMAHEMKDHLASRPARYI